MCLCYMHACGLVAHQIAHELLIELELSVAYRQ